MTDANEAPAATPDAAPAGVPVAAPDAAPAGVPLEPGVHSPGYSGKGTPVGGGGAEGPFTAGVPAIVRPHAEDQYAAELAALAAADDRPRPPSWRLSPWAVATYLLGGRLPDGTEITPKYIGSRRLVEVAVATLATDRALLLLGVPGTAKTWVSEHVAAAISGDSTLLVQGTSGTPEEAIRYGWNYARLLAEGPSRAAVVASPVMRAMERGAVARIEELTRIPSDVQDALITILSEKTLPIPELDALAEIRRVVTVFRELRSGVTADGRTKLKSPTATLSTAEAISVVTNGAALATHFGDGVLRAADVAAGLTGAIVKDPMQDGLVWAEYLETVVRERTDWDDLYRACRDLA